MNVSETKLNSNNNIFFLKWIFLIRLHFLNTKLKVLFTTKPCRYSILNLCSFKYMLIYFHNTFITGICWYKSQRGAWCARVFARGCVWLLAQAFWSDFWMFCISTQLLLQAVCISISRYRQLLWISRVSDWTKVYKIWGFWSFCCKHVLWLT